MELSISTPMPDNRNCQVIEHLDARPLRGRRQWSDEAKARIVSETLVPGANVSAIARRVGIAPSQLFTWRRKAVESELSASGEDGSAPRFTRFDPVYGSPVEIVVGDLIVRVSGNVDADHLIQVIRAARAA